MKWEKPDFCSGHRYYISSTANTEAFSESRNRNGDSYLINILIHFQLDVCHQLFEVIALLTQTVRIQFIACWE